MPGRQAGAEERQRPGPDATGRTGARHALDVDAVVAVQHLRQPGQPGVEHGDVSRGGALLRAVDRGRPGRTGQRVVDVAGDDDLGRRRAAGPGGRCRRGPGRSARRRRAPAGGPSPSSRRAPSAAARPVPPSVVALPPTPSTSRSTPSSSAAATSSPVPYVPALRGSGVPPGSRVSPEAAASSTTAVRGVGARRARGRRPRGPARRWGRRPCARGAASRRPAGPSTVPSPPSATGCRRTSSVDAGARGRVAQAGLDRRRHLVRGEAPLERVGGDDHGQPRRCGHTRPPAVPEVDVCCATLGSRSLPGQGGWSVFAPGPHGPRKRRTVSP